MKIHLLSRVRNEEDIISSSINHWSGFANGRIVIYDDCSTDDTRKIIRHHSRPVTLIEGKEHHKDRDFANYWCREEALKVIRAVARPGDWVVCADADERLEMDWNALKTLPAKYQAVAVRLFDFYITPNDVGKGWQAREWIGPEYRDIIMLWRHHPAVRFDQPSQRVPTMPFSKSLAAQLGYCRHYGKARSVDHWEAKCRYYQGHFSAQPQMRDKWKFRQGKAVKTDYLSDFKNPLCKWEDKDKFGVPLTAQHHEQEFR